jgi:hypothetical protein
MKTCLSHRVVMVSSELIWPSRFQYGTPSLQRVTFKCLACGETTVKEFKEGK